MSKVFSPQDWQQLSNYLDGQLSTKDRQAVEELINSSDIWKINYQSLAQTRQLLRAAPNRRSPRNFTLSQAQADRVRRPRFAFFSFRFASALSTGLAVVVFLFSFLLKTSTSALPAMQAAPAMEKASQSESAGSTPAGPIIIWGPPGTIPQSYGATGTGFGRGGGGGGGAEGPGVIPYGVGGGAADSTGGMGGGGAQTFSLETPTEKAVTEGSPEVAPEVPPEVVTELAPALTPEPTPEAAPNMAAAPATVAEPGVAAVPAPDTVAAPAPIAPDMVPQPTQLPGPTPASSEIQVAPQPAPEITGLGPILGVQPSDQVRELVQPPVVAPQQPTAPNRNPLWVASGALLLIGIVSGLIALFKSRKNQR